MGTSMYYSMGTIHVLLSWGPGGTKSFYCAKSWVSDWTLY